MNKQTSKYLISAALLGIISACGGPPARPACTPEENAQLRIEASDRLNPDENGRPLPTIVRIYQLDTIGAMETATFEEIWENDEETLGESMLGKDEVVIYPETRITHPFERNPEANFIVGVAIVRRPTGVSWRTILELPPPAADAQCAALQEDPEAAPEEPPTVYVAFELDGYQIEGSVRLEYPPPPCDETDVICIAEREAEETVDGAEESLDEAAESETPDVPETPDASDAASEGASSAASDAAGNLPSTSSVPTP